MPPVLAWFDSAAALRDFFVERVFATPWRLVAMTASGQLAFACTKATGTGFPLSAINVLTLRGSEVIEMTGFVDPAVHRYFPVAPRLPT